jgi:2-keto-4-pentenoate hydratase/2-oxohepta-3-ene-1,7-dioic acid hydratase in catechol pathway
MIRNIWAVGRNYADHAKELGNQAPDATSTPMIFLKAGSSIVFDQSTFALPSFSRDVHHEVEVAVQFGADQKLSGIAIALDLTARDLQNELKAKGHPWTLAKSFRHACLLGPIAPLPGSIDNLEFSLKVNGEIRQQGSTHDMIHSFERLRTYVCERFPVVENDLLLTGTPAGVGPLKAGDRLEAEIRGLTRAAWRVE